MQNALLTKFVNKNRRTDLPTRRMDRAGARVAVGGGYEKRKCSHQAARHSREPSP